MNSSLPENHLFFGGQVVFRHPCFTGMCLCHGEWFHHQSMSRDLCTHCQESLMGNDHTPYTMFWPWSKYVGAVMFLLELPRKGDVCPGWNGTAQKWERHGGPPVSKSYKLKQPTISAGIGFQHLHAWSGATWNKPCIHILLIIYIYISISGTNVSHPPVMWVVSRGKHQLHMSFPSTSLIVVGFRMERLSDSANFV